jgi:hypothetical protein
MPRPGLWLQESRRALVLPARRIYGYVIATVVRARDAGRNAGPIQAPGMNERDIVPSAPHRQSPARPLARVVLGRRVVALL